MSQDKPVLSREQVEWWTNSPHRTDNERAIGNLALAALDRQGSWIPVGERLPEKWKNVLIWHALGDDSRCDHAFDVAWYTDEGWLFPWDRDKQRPQWVRAWMPLPPAPQQQGTDGPASGSPDGGKT